MAEIGIGKSSIGGNLRNLLEQDDVLTGGETNYELCKDIFLYHPLGPKLAQMPVELAMSQQRIITIPGPAEEMVRDEFNRIRKQLGVDTLIFNTGVLSRVYGVAGSVALDKNNKLTPITMLTREVVADPKVDLTFNVVDPLNMSGSFVLTQDPNDPNFQKHIAIKVAGTEYHPTRGVTIMNEQSIYISFTTSAYGYVGRSVYQRVLYLLQSFIESMRTDRLVARKAGLIIAKIDQGGSIADRMMAFAAGFKRKLLRMAVSDDVVSIGLDEEVSAIDLQNVDDAHESARKHILENLAAGATMPAILMNNETFAGALHEGGEDAKTVARYISKIRDWLQILYEYFDKVVMWRAWTPEFYERVQKRYPRYRKISFEKAVSEWEAAFNAEWPNLLIEPDSEKIKSENIKAREIVGMFTVLAPSMSPEGLVKLVQFAQENLNENELLFPHQLDIDLDELETWLVKRSNQSVETDEIELEAAQLGLEAQKQAMEAPEEPEGGSGGAEGGSSGGGGGKSGKSPPKGGAGGGKGSKTPEVEAQQQKRPGQRYNRLSNRTPAAAGGDDVTPKARVGWF